MRCDNCGKEDNWIVVIGSSFICKKCINKHKIMGLLFRTHINTFQYALRQLKVKNYDEFMKITREQLEAIIDFRKAGVKLETTNVVELD